MGDRKIKLADLATTGKTTIRVTVNYSKGGMNFYDYTTSPSGYWLQVAPIEIEISECGNFRMERFSFGSGRRFFVAEASRFGRKALERAADTGRDMMDAAVSMVCEDAGFTLA